jgi:hypothetical protein
MKSLWCSNSLRILMLLTGMFLIGPPERVVGGDGSGVGYITEFYLNAPGNFVRIKFSQPIKNPEGCEAAEFYVRELNETAGATRFLAILSSAYFERKEVSFYIQGCSENKWWGATRPSLWDIYVHGDSNEEPNVRDVSP